MDSPGLYPKMKVTVSGTYICKICKENDSAVRFAFADYVRQKGLTGDKVENILSESGIDSNEPITKKIFLSGEVFDVCPRHQSETEWLIETEDEILPEEPKNNSEGETLGTVDSSPNLDNTGDSVTDDIDLKVEVNLSKNISDNKVYRKKVGGWLLLLCLSLAVFNPILTLGSFAVTLSESSRYFNRFPGLRDVTVIDSILSFALMAFSVYAGIGLWTLRENAVQTAKRCLLFYLGYYFIAAILPFTAGLPSSSHSAMMAQVTIGTIRGIIYVSIWYSYLNKSKRVRETYT